MIQFIYYVNRIRLNGIKPYSLRGGADFQTLHKTQDRHNIYSFSSEFNNKNIKKVFRANLPPPPPPDKIR